MAKFCPDCGKACRDTFKHCRHCGCKLNPSGTTIIPNPKILDNRYEIISTVKAGAMGCVYKAKDTRLDNVVAVKQMLNSFTNPEDIHYAETRFKEEAKMLSTLKHNGLPKVIDFFVEKELSSGRHLHYLVMEFIEGKDLETLIKENNQKPFSVEESLACFTQILNDPAW